METSVNRTPTHTHTHTHTPPVLRIYRKSRVFFRGKGKAKGKIREKIVYFRFQSILSPLKRKKNLLFRYLIYGQGPPPLRTCP